MTKLNTKIRKKILTKFKEGLDPKEVAKILNLDRSRIWRFYLLFKGGNESWVNGQKNNLSSCFDEEERVRITKEILNSLKSPRQASIGYQIDLNIIYIWIRNFKLYGICHLKRGRISNEEKDNELVKKRLFYKRLRETKKRERILDRLSNLLHEFKNSRSKKKLKTIIDLCNKHNISILSALKLTKISKSTFYYWKNKYLYDTIINKDKSLIDTIREIQEENKYTVGICGMTNALRCLNKVVNHKKVQRLMKENNLNARIKRKKHPNNYYVQLKEDKENIPANLLERNFKSEEPFKKLCNDVTYIKTTDGFKFLSCSKDLYNNEIVSYVISDTIDQDLVIKTMEKISSHLKGCIVHSDRGCQYMSKSYRKCLQDYGAIQSASAPGTPLDNAPIESFFSTFKSELIHIDDKLYSGKEMTAKIEKWIWNYNNKRKVKKLGFLSPIEYKKLHYKI